MPSLCTSLGLLVVLGALLVRGSPVQHATGDPLQVHDAIADDLKLKETDISGRPLFNSVIKSINTACMGREQIQLINTTLDVYAHIFSSILHRQHHHAARPLLDQVSGSSRSQVESSLVYLQKTMEDLKKRLSGVHQQNPNHEDVLRGLWRIKVDDPMEQRRALAQYKEVHRAASVVASRTCSPNHLSV